MELQYPLTEKLFTTLAFRFFATGTLQPDTLSSRIGNSLQRSLSLVQGGGGLPLPVGGSAGGRGRQRPPPKETPCSCTSRACTLYNVHTYRGPWQCASSSCIQDNFFSRTLCLKFDFFSFVTKSAPTVANMFLSINISNSDNLN